jgi:multimeric flavodoxin WrbA
MKVLAVNASPNRDKGITSLILTPFLDGIKSAGGEVDLFYTSDLDIKPCRGEYNCWLKTPGQCFQDDDMRKVIPKFESSDALIFGAPVYVDGVPGPLKMLMDRLISTGLPFIEVRDDHCRHAARSGRNQEIPFALVSVCGFWELDNFDPMVVHMKAFCKNAGMTFSGALLRPHGGAMYAMKETGQVNDIFNAARDAGAQFVKTGKISESNLSTISRELIPRELFIQYANEHFSKTLSSTG